MTMGKILPGGAILMSFAILFSGCASPPSESQIGPELDRTAPAFTLPDLKGREYSLDQYKGKIVLLDFWATWCMPCQMTMPLLEGLEREYHGHLALLAINLQEPKEIVRDYMKRQKLNSQVLLDEEGKVAEAYGAISIPMQILIDRKGIVRFIQLGFNPHMAAQLREEIEKLL